MEELIQSLSLYFLSHYFGEINSFLHLIPNEVHEFSISYESLHHLTTSGLLERCIGVRRGRSGGRSDIEFAGKEQRIRYMKRLKLRLR